MPCDSGAITSWATSGELKTALHDALQLGILCPFANVPDGASPRALGAPPPGRYLFPRRAD